MVRSLSLRLRALLALSAFVGSLSLPLVSFGHLTLDDDRACGSIVLALGHPWAQLEPIRPSLPADHCALCHWLRAVGGSRTSDVVTPHTWLEPAASAPVLTLVWRPALLVTERPSRAPPPAIG
jgi:hypothetical protein